MEQVIITPIAEWEALQAKLKELETIKNGAEIAYVRGAFPVLTSMVIYNPDEITAQVAHRLEMCIAGKEYADKALEKCTWELAGAQQRLRKISRHWFFGMFIKYK